MENPIDAILKTIKGESGEKNKILFESGEDNVDLRTDLKYPENVLLNTLIQNDLFLVSCGLDPIYKDYIEDFLRKNVSLDRKSREEFVTINKKDFMEDNLARLGSISNLQEARK